MSEEIDILIAAQGFHQLIGDLLEALDDEWLSQVHSRMRPGGRIDLASLGQAIFFEQFRFTYAEVKELVIHLDLPGEFVCPEARVKEDSFTALCMLLRRLASPARLCDIEMQCGWEATRFSRITRLVAQHIYNRWKHLLRFDPTRLTPYVLEQFAQCMHAKGSPHSHVCSLMDGTLEEISRPTRNQRLVFNGWKRMHCLKYHVIISPDGMIIHVFGPIEGRRHDEMCFKQSGVLQILEKHFWTPGTPETHKPLIVYGDPAYTVSTHVCTPYKGAALTEAQHLFNTRMSRIREPVEWVFKEIGDQFGFLNFTKNQKLLLQPVGLYYLVAVLLCNCHTILHHLQISQYFRCKPPTLAEYFQGGPVADEELDAWCLQALWAEMDVPDE
ncbi:hypothetical protein MVEN_01751200 [Mycena venus]|uniref:DDE Tnp4 domain-containing protein n=1 Tax=Mycena venus TaxID=2733690 RepID=A0A8H6XKC5_9AGAR|nr:hypothetical protein MVEN_01751200 [Mycena venus]